MGEIDLVMHTESDVLGKATLQFGVNSDALKPGWSLKRWKEPFSKLISFTQTSS